MALRTVARSDDDDDYASFKSWLGEHRRCFSFSSIPRLLFFVKGRAKPDRARPSACQAWHPAYGVP